MFYSMMCFPPNPTDSQDSPWLFWYRKSDMDSYGNLKISPNIWHQQLVVCRCFSFSKEYFQGFIRSFSGGISSEPWYLMTLGNPAVGCTDFLVGMGTKKQAKSVAYQRSQGFFSPFFRWCLVLELKNSSKPNSECKWKNSLIFYPKHSMWAYLHIIFTYIWHQLELSTLTEVGP